MPMAWIEWRWVHNILGDPNVRGLIKSLEVRQVGEYASQFRLEFTGRVAYHERIHGGHRMVIEKSSSIRGRICVVDGSLLTQRPSMNQLLYHALDYVPNRGRDGMYLQHGLRMDNIPSISMEELWE